MLARLYLWMSYQRMLLRMWLFRRQNKTLEQTDRLAYMLKYIALIEPSLYESYRPSDGMSLSIVLRFKNAYQTLVLMDKISRHISESSYIQDDIMKNIYEPVQRRFDEFLTDDLDNDINLVVFAREFLIQANRLSKTFNEVQGDGSLKAYYRRRIGGVFSDTLTILEALQNVALREWVKT